MARPIRIEYEGAVYHVTIRGNERKALFSTDADRERFVNSLADSVERYDVRLQGGLGSDLSFFLKGLTASQLLLLCAYG